MEPENIPTPTGAEWAAFVQQQVQTVLQATLPQIIQQVTNHTTAKPHQGSPTAAWKFDDASHSSELGKKESKVANPERFSGKKGNEVYRWFAQLRLVFRGKPRMYGDDADKVAYALSYMTGASQNWAMPILQALDEGREHVLLRNYDAFRESVIGVYGDLDRRGNAEDRLGKLRQTGSVASYISTFNEYAAQVDWNESGLVARFRAGLKDEILDSVATAQTQPRTLQEWILMASRIDERLWGRRQARRSSSELLTQKTSSLENQLCDQLPSRRLQALSPWNSEPFDLHLLWQKLRRRDLNIRNRVVVGDAGNWVMCGRNVLLIRLDLFLLQLLRMWRAEIREKREPGTERGSSVPGFHSERSSYHSGLEFSLGR